MDAFKIPDPIPNTCGVCQYYRRSHLNDQYRVLDWVSKGYCTFYERHMFFDTPCWALHLIQENKDREIQDSARLFEAKERAIKEHKKVLNHRIFEIEAQPLNQSSFVDVRHRARELAAAGLSAAEVVKKLQEAGVRPSFATEVVVQGEELPFNWGAFILTPLWCLFHGRVGIGLLLIVWTLIWAAFLFAAGAWGISLIHLGIMLYFGISGNKIAWEEKGYMSLQDVRESQRRWNIGGIIVAMIMMIFVLATLT